MSKLSEEQSKWVKDFLATLGGTATAAPPAPAKEKSGDTDRQASCHVTVTNNSGVALVLVEQRHERGDFMKFPDKLVKSGANTEFISVETPDSDDDGCKGYVVWQVGGPGECSWRIEWDNPEQAKNTSSSTLSGSSSKNYRGLDQIGQGDENVPAEFTISAVGAPSSAPPDTGGATIGVINSSTNGPIGSASVTLAGKNPNSSDSGAGKYEFEKVPAGDLDISITAPDFEPHTGTVIVKAGKTTKYDAYLDPKKSAPGPAAKTGQLTVKVKDLVTSAPIGDAKVMVAGKEPTSIDAATGSYSYAEVPEGNQPLGITAPNYQVYNGTALIRLDVNNHYGAYMQPKNPLPGPEGKMGRVTIEVKDIVTDEPIGDAKVTVAGKEPTSIIASTGGYTFAEVPEGDQPLAVTAPNHKDYKGNVLIRLDVNNQYNAFMQPIKT